MRATIDFIVAGSSSKPPWVVLAVAALGATQALTLGSLSRAQHLLVEIRFHADERGPDASLEGLGDEIQERATIAEDGPAGRILLLGSVGQVKGAELLHRAILGDVRGAVSCR